MSKHGICLNCHERVDVAGICDVCGLRWSFASERAQEMAEAQREAFRNSVDDPEVPSLEATAKLYRERERRDRWWEALLEAYAKSAPGDDFGAMMTDANNLVACFDRTFPLEEPDTE